MLNILFISSFLVLLVASITGWMFGIARTRTTGTLLESREQHGTPFGFSDVILMFLFWFGGQLGSVGIAMMLLKLEPSQLNEVAGDQLAWMTILIAMGNLTATSLGMLVLFVRYRRLSVFGWQPKCLGRDVSLGGLAFILVVPAILIVQWLLTQFIEYEHSTLEMLAKNADALTIAASWFGAVLVAPVCEEIFFRGVLQGWLQRLRPGSFFTDQVLTGGWDEQDQGLNANDPGTGEGKTVVEPVDSGAAVTKTTPAPDPNPYATPQTMITKSIKSLIGKENSTPYWPIFVSAAVFGLAHAGQGPAPIPLFLFGLALGYVFRKTGSIVPCIVLHMLLNAYSMFWFTIQVLFKEEAVEPPTAVVQHLVSFSVYVTGLF